MRIAPDNRLSRARSECEGERGVVIVLVALVMVALLVIVAFVIDYGVVRQTRQENKSAADFAVTAGLRGLETPQGVPRSWGGVCEALEFLKANQDDLADLTGTFMDGAGADLGFNPCDSTATAPYTTLCVPGDTTTWGWFSGAAKGGALLVQIKSGYTLPDPSFPEDAAVYSSDNAGDPAQGGCDQLAVTLEETDPTFFGQVAGADDYDTVMRSVGRVQIGSDDVEAVALLLLEDEDCETLVTQGNSTYVRVRATPIGAPTRPGLIQSNSDASGACGGSARVIEGSSACPAISGCSGSGPSVVAEDASTSNPGKIGVHAAGGTSLQRALVSTTACTSATTASAGCTVAPIPADRGTVTRAPVDARYLANVKALKSAVTATNPSGYFQAANNGACNSLLGSTVTTARTGGNPRVYLNCDVTVSPGTTVTFDDSITDVVITGKLDVKGSLFASNVDNFFVKGSGGVNVDGILSLNQGTSASCTARFNTTRTEITKFVILNGPFNASSGATQVRLCNTFMFLANGALPLTEGTAPSNNSYNGRINIGAQASLDWRAPNQTDNSLDVGDPLLKDFEDMALWTEYSGSSVGTGPGIGGQGAVVTTGVFFLPNANPFNIAGGGSGAVLNIDAQFIVRKLRLSGTVALEMAPNPSNVVPTPKFEGFALIR